MDRRCFLISSVAALASHGGATTAMAQGKRSWVQISVSGGWGKTSTIRIYEDGRITRTITPALGEKGRPKVQRYRATPNHWANVEEVLYWWEDGPTLKGDTSRDLDGPVIFPTDTTPPAVTIYSAMAGGEPYSYVQEEAEEGQTVPNVYRLVESLHTAIGLPLWDDL